MKAGITGWLANKPLSAFTLISLMLIAAMVVVSGYTQSKFFENALIDREAEIVNQTVIALALHELRAEDFDDYASATSQQHFERGFSSLKGIPEVIRLKLYNSDNVIVWSDAKELVGKYLPKTDEHLARVWAGIPSGVFDPAKRTSHAKDPLPNIPLVEFYVPLSIKKQGVAGGEIKAVVAVYRSAKGLADTLRHGMFLLWLVIAIGGTLLFFGLFHLFRMIYRRKREVENQLYRLNTEHERAEMAVIKAKAKFHTLFDSISDAVLIVGMNGRFIHVNSSACTRLGYSYEEMLQMSPADIDTPEYAEKVPERIKKILEQGKLVFETTQVRKDGVPIPVELNARIIDYDGKPAIMSVARDMTERKRMENALQQAKEAAELALAEQRQLIAMISHEYRSPLAVIDSATQLLSIKLATESDTAPIIARIRRGVFRLANFLDNCLIEGRMDSDGLTLHSSSTNLYALAESVIESAQLISESHRFIAELDPDLPMLDSDQQLMGVMLLNLLGNAIKYSPPGSEIRLRIKHTGQACSFEVIDQGPGIPADELPFVFKKYMRGRAVTSIPGAGLGLSLVAKIAALHGGRVEMESREGEGAHVTVTIPLTGMVSSHP
ncbi:MAG: PAS domain-containing sensor histidine kinase [Gallionella sp.]|nr:PAS domain-containing sensor histidine kinase [Gallionella sp.]